MLLTGNIDGVGLKKFLGLISNLLGLNFESTHVLIWTKVVPRIGLGFIKIEFRVGAYVCSDGLEVSGIGFGFVQIAFRRAYKWIQFKKVL